MEEFLFEMDFRQGGNRPTCQTTTWCFVSKGQGIERCGKDRVLLYQVRFNEVKEMRLNHRRGIVKVIGNA